MQAAATNNNNRLRQFCDLLQTVLCCWLCCCYLLLLAVSVWRPPVCNLAKRCISWPEIRLEAKTATDATAQKLFMSQVRRQCSQPPTRSCNLAPPYSCQDYAKQISKTLLYLNRSHDIKIDAYHLDLWILPVVAFGVPSYESISGRQGFPLSWSIELYLLTDVAVACGDGLLLLFKLAFTKEYI